MEPQTTGLPLTSSQSSTQAPAAGIAPPKSMWGKLLKRGIAAIIAAAVIGAGLLVWMRSKPSGPGDGFVRGNGRIEAAEVDIATKLAGPVQEILVNEGDFVQAGQLLAEMRIDGLIAQRDEARAKYRHDVTAIASVEAKVLALQSDTTAQQAIELQRKSDLELALVKFARIEVVAKNGGGIPRRIRRPPSRSEVFGGRDGRGEGSSGFCLGGRQSRAGRCRRSRGEFGGDDGDHRPNRSRHPGQPFEVAPCRPHPVPHRAAR